MPTGKCRRNGDAKHADRQAELPGRAPLPGPGNGDRRELPAYPFQKYGMPEGTVRTIAPDVSNATTQDPKSPRPTDLGFKAVVGLETQQLQSRGQPFVLNPGMQVVAEIRQWRADRDGVPAESGGGDGDAGGKGTMIHRRSMRAVNAVGSEGLCVVARSFEPGTASEARRILGQAAILRVHCHARTQRESKWQS
jgi:hypothetical protein